jgi:hypothetical protein
MLQLSLFSLSYKKMFTKFRFCFLFLSVCCLILSMHIFLGAIQIIRHALGVRGKRQCHQFGICQSVTLHFFKNINNIFSLLGHFKISHYTGGRYGTMSQNDTWARWDGGGGVKISQKSVTYFLNGPLCIIVIIKNLIMISLDILPLSFQTAR